MNDSVYPASSVTDLTAADAAVKAMEVQVLAIKDRLRDETLAIPKAEKLMDASLKQQRKLKDMSISGTPMLNLDTNRCLFPGSSQQNTNCRIFKLEEDHAPPPPPKVKKGRSMSPLRFITAEELESLSSWQETVGKRPWNQVTGSDFLGFHLGTWHMGYTVFGSSSSSLDEVRHSSLVFD